MTTFRNSLNKSLLITLNNDYDNLFFSIVHKFGYLNPDLTVINLQKLYLDNYSKLYKLEDKKVKGNKLTHRIALDDNRCMARTWANGKVELKDGKIIYGERCKRNKEDNTHFCGIHSKSLTHGRFDLDPPHDHYKKYLKKLI